MFYRAVIVKEKTNSKTITLRAKSKEDIEEMMPRIKSFLYPDEDASGCRYLIWTHEVEAYSPGVKIPEYQVTVYKPEEKKVVEGFEDWEDDEAPSVSLSKNAHQGKVEKGFLANRREKKEKKAKKSEGWLSLHFLFANFFEIHGSKFKPYPIRDLGEAAVGCITHRVFFFCIRKDPFNGFFALLVKVGILGSIACVIGKLFVILPNMPLYDLHRILGMCAKMSCRAILTYFGIALVFSVSVSIGRTVCKRMVLRTNDAIVILIVFVLPPFVSAVHCLRSFVCRTENTIVIKYLFANMGSFVSTVCYNGFYLGKPLRSCTGCRMKRLSPVSPLYYDLRFRRPQRHRAKPIPLLYFTRKESLNGQSRH